MAIIVIENLDPSKQKLVRIYKVSVDGTLTVPTNVTSHDSGNSAGAVLDVGQYSTDVSVTGLFRSEDTYAEPLKVWNGASYDSVNNPSELATKLGDLGIDTYELEYYTGGV